VLIGGDGVCGSEDLLRHATGLINDHEHVLIVDALKARLVLVVRLHAERDWVLTSVHLPLGVGTNLAAYSCLPLGARNLLPQDVLDLSPVRGSGHDRRVIVRVYVHPPCDR